MAKSTGKKKGPKTLLGEDLIKRRQEHHAKKLESHQKIKKWLGRERYRANLEEIRSTMLWADIVVSICTGIFMVIFGLARSVRYVSPSDDTMYGLIAGYALVILMFLILFGVPAGLMLIALFYYRK